MNIEQIEAAATTIVREHTEDVYVGPNITEKSMRQMVDAPTMVYLEPDKTNDRRVIVAHFDDREEFFKASSKLIHMQYAPGYMTSGKHGNIAVKWVNVSDDHSTNSTGQ